MRLVRSLSTVCSFFGAASLFPASAEDVSERVVRGERINVTGSNIPRIGGESGLPLQVLTRQDLEHAGVQTAEDFLQRISAHQGTANWNEGKGLGTSLGGFTGASLRGLGLFRTLVLVNGRRVASYALALENGVDVSAIPLSAIERVEILKDGASAIYGSDAIGGVINFILRKDYRGGEVYANYFSAERRSWSSWRATAVAGYGDLERDGFNGLITADHLQQSRLRSVDRAFARTAYIPSLGFDQTSFNSAPANVMQAGFPRRALAPCLPPDSFPTAAWPARCMFDYAAQIDLLPSALKDTLYARVTGTLGPRHRFFLEGSYYRGEFTYRMADPGVAFPLLPTAPAYPSAFVAAQPGGDPTQPIFVNYRLLGLGGRVTDSRTTDTRWVAGMQGALGKWDYESAFAISQDTASTGLVSGYPSASTFRELLDRGEINLLGRNSDEVLRTLRASERSGKTIDARTASQSFDFRASREGLALRHGPLAVAVGLEARRETARLSKLALVSSGDFVTSVELAGPLFAFSEASRRVASVFMEANAPLGSGFEATAALRSDRYSDFGTTTNPKGTIRWQVGERALLRASAGTGFRAPALSDLFLPGAFEPLDFPLSDPLRCPQSPQDCNATYIRQLGGNPALQPEKSRQANVGVVIEPVMGAAVSVDGYWVKVTDLIGHPGASFDHVVRGPPDPDFPALPGRVLYMIDVPLNLGTLNTSGIDVDVRYRQMTAAGRFSFSMTGTYVLTYQAGSAAAIYPRSLGHTGSGGTVVSPWRHYAALDWSRGAWGATVANTFHAGYYETDLKSCVPPWDPFFGKCPGERRVGSVSSWDFQLRFERVRGIAVAAGVQNLMNRAPPASGQIVFTQVGYDPSYGDPRGRVLYLSLRYPMR